MNASRIIGLAQRVRCATASRHGRISMSQSYSGSKQTCKHCGKQWHSPAGRDDWRRTNASQS